MTTPSYSELVTAIRREGEGLVSAAGMGLDAEVPACDGWDVRALVEHVSKVYARIVRIVSSRASEPPEAGTQVPAGEPIDVLCDLLDDLVSELSDCDPETPLWNWAPDAPQDATFWARRMAHESAVHRFDAQAAHGVMQPIDADLASDGIDELIDVIAARVYTRDDVNGPTGTVTLHATDNEAWHLHLAPKGLQRAEAAKEPDAVVSATTSALLLAAYGRVPWSALDVTGKDTELLDRWSAALNF
jgi:uncharacterized protein (TIGR03083 family)